MRTRRGTFVVARVTSLARQTLQMWVTAALAYWICRSCFMGDVWVPLVTVLRPLFTTILGSPTLEDCVSGSATKLDRLESSCLRLAITIWKRGDGADRWHFIIMYLLQWLIHHGPENSLPGPIISKAFGLPICTAWVLLYEEDLRLCFWLVSPLAFSPLSLHAPLCLQSLCRSTILPPPDRIILRVGHLCSGWANNPL